MDLLREHTGFGRAVFTMIRLGAIAGGLGVIIVGFAFAANVGEIIFGAPIIFKVSGSCVACVVSTGRGVQSGEYRAGACFAHSGDSIPRPRDPS